VKSIGDSLMCIFAKPSVAVERAIEIQETLAEYNQSHSDDSPIEVRIGMHMGQVLVEDELQTDVFGRHVNRAARVESLADGGQVLLTLSVYDSAKGWLTERQLIWHDHGEYLLKGIDGATKIYEVCRPNCPGPRTPRGKRVRRRSAWPWIAAALLFSAIPIAWMFRPAEPPLNCTLSIRVLRGDQVFVDLVDAIPLRSGDQLQLTGKFDRPVHSALYWIDEKGNADLLASSGDEREKVITYPEGKDTWVTLEGNVGTEMVILVTADEPLSDVAKSISEIKTKGALPSSENDATVWISARETRIESERTRSLGSIKSQSLDDLHYRIDQLRVSLLREFSDFHGVAFPHRLSFGDSGNHKTLRSDREQHGGQPAPSRNDTQNNSSANISRHALLVGCTKYDSLPENMQLQGPSNDVALMRKLLMEHFDFADNQIVTLTEDSGSRPTRFNIEREFQRLAKTADAGDRIVILLAGHGSQQPDDNPDDPQDPEPDGLDEIFLPADISGWDADRKTVTNAITDDMIRKWLTAIGKKGAFVWLIADACHSGTLIRGGSDEVLRHVRPALLVPQTALEQSRRSAPPAAVQQRGGSLTQEALDLPQVSAGVVALYASQSTEPTIEKLMPLNTVKRKPYGLLTYTIYQVLNRTTSAITYRELVQEVHQQYIRWGRTYPTPSLEGTELDQEVLGQNVWKGRSRILLQRDRQDNWIVNAGAVHGMTAGSLLKVQPPAGDANNTAIVGYIHIEEVRSLSSIVRPHAYRELPAKMDLPVGGRCEIIYRDYGDFRLRLALDENDLENRPIDEDLKQQLTVLLQKTSQTPGTFLSFVKENNTAQWLLRADSRNAYLVSASGWAVDGKANQHVPQPLFGPAPIDAKLPAWIEDRLRRIARVSNLLALAGLDQGPLSDADVGLDVDLEMRRYESDTSKDHRLIPWDNGRTLQAGDIVGFRIHNRSTEVVDATLLFIDSSFGITAYYPQPFVSNRMEPGQSRNSARARVTKTMGLEHILLIAVKAEPQKQPFDFSFLSQTGIERARSTAGDAGAFNSPLGRLLQRSAFALGSKRGLEVTEIRNYVVRLISWKVDR
jgi:hypothetical protein